MRFWRWLHPTLSATVAVPQMECPPCPGVTVSAENRARFSAEIRRGPDSPHRNRQDCPAASQRRASPLAIDEGPADIPLIFFQTPTGAHGSAGAARFGTI